MTYQNENHEMIKQIILNEQLGNPKKLKLVIVEESLSDKDKERIKQAILESVAKNTAYLPEELAESACKAICLIDSYKH
ncbi:hypothetical protein NYR30_06850 [Gallibacterium salpingitidis]|uniref:hypothetical protein n=1 Tax=Gallibacterium salpingitidis TaxID=505341 RepID=UPI00266FF908|nr:hypothetical protein [Gallibacterium salpingitidis]WKS98507.1 hypothetical protein NYR30_06850 [Gallibacterium salpingitidis]